ncbi:MAG: sn-glycerol-3-phosphate ABC transporter ATP-binding protein UgpC [Bacillota bacterium]|nr:sn-glycerol-3-phosphate ABC transporter ATP-binding protein UgpC [Bacillota bacterium]
MANLELKSVRKIYKDDVKAVENFSLTVRNRELLVLVGPSGCGKSTVLRMIAGLESVTEGSIFVDGICIDEEPPQNRNMAMIFQNYALYPHMTVYGNIAFCLKMSRCSKEEIEESVRNVSRKLGIESLLQRKPKTLSGGERQRVAMGRAIVRKPSLFLMDEPLSNLDAKLRIQMRREIANLHRQIGATIIYVTHDQVEAMTLGDRIVVMKDGVIQQIDTPQNLYHMPCNLFVAGFIGTPQMNLLESTVVTDSVTGAVALELEGITISLKQEQQRDLETRGYVGRKIIMGIRAEDIKAAGQIGTEPCGSSCPVIIKELESHGSEQYAYLDFQGKELVMSVPQCFSKKKGDAEELSFSADHLHLFDRQTERRL